MLLLDGQVHHDTHAVPMGNYVIGAGNYVIATPSELGNYLSADTGPMRLAFAQVTSWPTPVQRLESAVLPAAQGAGGVRSEHTYGGPLGRRCCTFLLYCLFDSFEFRL